MHVGILLGAAQALATLSLSLILVAFLVTVLRFASTLIAVFLYPLGLGLLVGGSLGLGLGQSLLSLFRLLTLYFRVFGGIPGVKDLSREKKCQ